jgi:Tfp pilus assembly protein PilZ
MREEAQNRMDISTLKPNATVLMDFVDEGQRKTVVGRVKTEDLSPRALSFGVSLVEELPSRFRSGDTLRVKLSTVQGWAIMEGQISRREGKLIELLSYSLETAFLDRRGFQRLQFCLPVEIEAAEGVDSGYSMDMSEGGIRLRTLTKYAVGDTVQLVLGLSSQAKCHAGGHIRHRKQTDEHEWEYGIVFTAVAEQDRSLMRSHLRKAPEVETKSEVLM